MAEPTLPAETPTVAAETIQAGEVLMGVAYSAPERALMLDNLEAQIAAAQARRKLALPNDVPMALRFDPRLPGFPAFGPQLPVRPSDADPGAVPDSEEDIAFAPVARLGQWIARGALSSRRLTEIYLARIDRLAGMLECFVTVTAGLARAQADAADALLAGGTWLGPLHGIPYGLKDLFDTAGVRTSWGATPSRDRVPESDAAIVERLHAAGAVLIGKTTLGALAYGDVWFGGKTRNPWNREEGSSGSSAGSGAAVAAGLCGFAIGTETLGSITSPSQRCGTTGLRPTFGRVSRAGGMTLCWTLDKAGPMCRSVEDCALVLAAINGFDAADRGSIAAPFNFDAAAGVAGMRVGYLPDAFAAAGATAVDRAALDAARTLPIEVVPVTLPDLPYASLTAILQAEAAAAFEELTLSGRDDELERQDRLAWPNSFRKARFLSAVDHVQAERLRYRVMQALDGLFREVDALIGPFNTGPMLVASNFTGHPCLHLRAGFLRLATRPDPWATPSPPRDDAPLFEVPQGISLWGRLFDEGRLCNLGMALEAALGVADRRPVLTDGEAPCG
jgi:Asp-tRNA(Asn)/Glu-tRNA(Gln) amidotransferase A subunit family amidase